MATLVARPMLLHGEHAVEGKRPNVILCMADDLGWGDVGYNGNKIIKTPHVDKMAAEGVRFDRFYASSPVCSPTRASCLTGRHPYRTGVFFANVGVLRPEEVTIADLLKEQGYATGHFGKWHLGTFTTTEKDANRGGDHDRPGLLNPPSKHGFDTYFSTESKVPTWDPMRVPETFKKPENRKFGWRACEESSDTKFYGTHYWTPDGKVPPDDPELRGDDSRVIMDQALPFIEEAAKSDKPFLAVIWFHTPHLPCVAGPEYAAMYKDQDFEMQQYAGCITAMDEQMGRLRGKLKELGIDENTMLFFTSDNGPEIGTPGVAGPYRDRKRSLHEGGVRVPGLMTWPRMLTSPMVSDAPVVTSDYLPTILDVLGINAPYALDGESFLPLLQGHAFERQNPIAFVSHDQKSVNDRQYKLYTRGESVELYDVLRDQGEKVNLAETMPELVETYQKRFADWFVDLEASFKGKEYGPVPLTRLPQKWPGIRASESEK
ncbi:MAG: sulfatase [Kiritimatiellia bacterium]